MNKTLILFIISLLTFSTLVHAEKILILGDSHYAGTYGHELDRLLKEAGHEVESYGCVSATAQHYIEGGFHCVKPTLGSTHNSKLEDYNTKPINEYLTLFSPNVVLISLGGNIEASTSDKTARINQISQLVKAVTDKNIKCMWIGPVDKEDPSKKIQRDTFYTQLQEGLGTSCQLIDSRPYAKLLTSDTTGHFPSNDPRAKNWATSVFQKFQEVNLPFTGPPISAMETEEEKNAYQDFETETPIVEDASIPEETTNIGLVHSSAQSAAPSTQSFCDDQQRCKNIDEVWLKRIGMYITPEHKEQIWDPRTNSWKTFQEVYVPPQPQVSSQSFIPSTTLLPIDESTLSKKIQQEKAAGKYDDAFLAKVNQIASNLNTKPEYVIAVMRFETGGTFNPSLKSKWSSATGLIQFLSSTATRLGTSTEKLRTMTQLQQLEYVEKYFNWFKPKIRPNNLGDIAMAVFWPRAIGKEDTYVLFKEGTNAYNANKALDRDQNGEITRAEYLNLVIKRM